MTNTVNERDMEHIRRRRFLIAFVCGGIALAVIIGLGMWVYSLLFPSWGDPLLQTKEPPAWSGEHLQVDISLYLPQFPEYEVHVEFAARNEPYFLFWSLDPRGASQAPIRYKYKYVDIALGTNTVIDFQGNIVQATNGHGEFLPPYVTMFPETSYRQTHAEFIRDAEEWAFSPNGAYGMKSNRCYGEHLSSFCPVQLWDLAQDKLLWEQNYEGYGIDFTQFISWEGKACLLIAFSQRAIIVSQETGDILGGFQYLQQEGQNLPYGSGFSAFRITYNPTKRWLVCGEFEGRRVRIYSIDPPYSLVRELSTSIPPHPPLGGGWMVNGVKMNADGQYLTVWYGYSGKWIETSRYPTEVYNTETWELVWYENKAEVYAVTISPNGEKVTFLRDTILEMGEFE